MNYLTSERVQRFLVSEFSFNTHMGIAISFKTFIMHFIKRGSFCIEGGHDVSRMPWPVDANKRKSFFQKTSKIIQEFVLVRSGAS